MSESHRRSAAVRALNDWDAASKPVCQFWDGWAVTAPDQRILSGSGSTTRSSEH
ncbi:hypothetical protein HMPREF1979_00371 [Actinomyces johnsonii F0542]|uniref:Uncharacterized protein n=2 Tax=Actinomyces johnsonii TaxID=544581 RepID=U1S4I1_9ACTO|nr:hypothetical protein HMPREF1549_03222 [Actinomyces johnsonii F0510]ERH25567.1 hypothetical protein HMPREF1979_00371 [Actinomyces johnsonii F0542]